MARLLSAGTRAVLCGILSCAAWGRTPVDISRLGPQIGQRVPDFRLQDQNGKYWTLQSIAGAKGAMLVFYRSADW